MRIAQIGLVLALISFLSACSDSGVLRSLGTVTPKALSSTATEADRESSIWDAFNTNVSTTPVKVNRYIWQASLEVLDFMPIERIDPFSGIIVMGYGTPPGGRTAYRATVHVSEPAWMPPIARCAGNPQWSRICGDYARVRGCNPVPCTANPPRRRSPVNLSL